MLWYSPLYRVFVPLVNTLCASICVQEESPKITQNNFHLQTTQAYLSIYLYLCQYKTLFETLYNRNVTLNLNGLGK